MSVKNPRRLLLVLDCNYLAWRAFFSTNQGLSWGEKPTGVLYGFFRDLIRLREDFLTEDFVFCFDHGKKQKRQEVYPAYKQKRREVVLTEEQEQGLALMTRQLTDLKRTHLTAIGFRNVALQRGYEGDDMIASVVMRSLLPDDEAIIVSADKDLFQLLSPKVSMWDPFKRKLSTDSTFKMDYGIHPNRWATVKAVSGCTTDGVKGVPGIGEKTAVSWLKGTLGEKTDKARRIKEGEALIRENYRIVCLPFEGTRQVELRQDMVDRDSWDKVMRSLGMKSLVGAWHGKV